MSSASRRAFLKTLVTGSAAAVTVTDLPACLPRNNPAPPVDVDAYVAESKLVLDVTKYADLTKVGGSITARGSKLPVPVLIVNDPGGYYAVASTCTHVGCPLGYDGADVICPCHQSRFSPLTGAVLNPPATQKLRAFPTHFDPASNQLTVSFSTDGFPAVIAGLVTFPFAQFPQLQSSCGSVQGTPQGSTQPISVQFLPSGSYTAVDPTCTHQNCTVDFQCDALQFKCPCHGSLFNPDGTLVQGPATSPLKKFTVTADANGVTVTLS